MTAPDAVPILAIDVGASFIKVGRVRPDGELLEPARKEPTPYPCSPTRLVETLAADVHASGLARVGVGFPGAFQNGVVIEPGNLSRTNGIGTPIDPAVHAAWTGFGLEDALRRATQRVVRVVNDAMLAALGCVDGVGREFVLTLGTGCGIALVVDGVPERIRDVGNTLFHGVGTYDEVFGEPAREHDERVWKDRLVVAVNEFAQEYRADVVYVGGGNSRLLDPASFTRHVVLCDNVASLRGAMRLFYPFDAPVT